MKKDQFSRSSISTCILKFLTNLYNNIITKFQVIYWGEILAFIFQFLSHNNRKLEGKNRTKIYSFHGKEIIKCSFLESVPESKRLKYERRGKTLDRTRVCSVGIIYHDNATRLLITKPKGITSSLSKWPILNFCHLRFHLLHKGAQCGRYHQQWTYIIEVYQYMVNIWNNYTVCHN